MLPTIIKIQAVITSAAPQTNVGISGDEWAQNVQQDNLNNTKNYRNFTLVHKSPRLKQKKDEERWKNTSNDLHMHKNTNILTRISSPLISKESRTSVGVENCLTHSQCAITYSEAPPPQTCFIRLNNRRHVLLISIANPKKLDQTDPPPRLISVAGATVISGITFIISTGFSANFIRCPVAKRRCRDSVLLEQSHIMFKTKSTAPHHLIFFSQTSSQRVSRPRLEILRSTPHKRQPSLPSSSPK